MAMSTTDMLDMCESIKQKNVQLAKETQNLLIYTRQARLRRSGAKFMPERIQCKINGLRAAIAQERLALGMEPGSS